MRRVFWGDEYAQCGLLDRQSLEGLITTTDKWEGKGVRRWEIERHANTLIDTDSAHQKQLQLQLWSHLFSGGKESVIRTQTDINCISVKGRGRERDRATLWCCSFWWWCSARWSQTLYRTLLERGTRRGMRSTEKTKMTAFIGAPEWQCTVQCWEEGAHHRYDWLMALFQC